MDPFKLALYTLGFIVLLVLTQDIHIFPGAFISKLGVFWNRNKKTPPQVISQFIKSKDGTTLEVWRYQPEEKTDLSDYVAIIFHGNGSPLENFIFIQMWLAELGIPSYNFDYRGYGRSSGWPSEKGIYLDSDAIWEHVMVQEGVDASRVVIVGISVGGAPAARVAAQHSPKLLLLSSAFTDLRSTVRAQPILGILWPFVWHKFSTIEYVSRLGKTDLILAHGTRDKIVPCKHSKELESAYKGTGQVRRLISDVAGHNLVFYDLKDELKESLLGLL